MKKKILLKGNLNGLESRARGIDGASTYGDGGVCSFVDIDIRGLFDN